MKLLKRIWDWILQKPHYTEEELLFGPVNFGYHRVITLTLDMDHFKGMKEPELVPKVWPVGYAVEGDVMKRDVFFHDVTWQNDGVPGICPTAVV